MYGKPIYIVKVKGKSKIPDYVQFRDENFCIIAYFRTDRELKKIDKYGLQGKEKQLKNLIDRLPFGKIQTLNL